MKVTNTTKKIIANYTHENVGVRYNLMRMLGQGKLGGTGRMIILPVDQGFEHGPDRSFAVNPAAYDPNYHHQLAIDAGLSAYAAPLGLLQTSSDSFHGQIPTILKINSSNTLATSLDQAVAGSIDDALKLGCSAIGFTIYPGSDCNFSLMEEYQALSHEAKAKGLAVVLWAYARGSNISKKGETAMNIISYAAHMSALLGANIIKVKLPSDFLEEDPTKAAFENNNITMSTLKDRVAHIKKVVFEGKRLVVFSGGDAKDDSALMDEIKVAEQSYDGTAIGMAIANATNRLRHSDSKSKVMILLSDGSNNAGELDPLTAADLAAKFEIKIYTIGAGTNQDVSFIPGRGYIRNEIDEETLKSISKRTNGQYFRATNLSGLEQIYDTIDTLERTEIEIKEFTQYKELFGWFLIPALILGLSGQTLDRTLFRRKI